LSCSEPPEKEKPDRNSDAPLVGRKHERPVSRRKPRHKEQAPSRAKARQGKTGDVTARNGGGEAEEARESDGRIQSEEGGEQQALDPAEQRTARVGEELEEGTMTQRQTGKTMSPGLLKVAERARKYPEARFNSLAHLIDEEALKRSLSRIRKDAAAGVDGVTKEQYEQDAETKLKGLHERMKTGRYRHQPIRRVYIGKDTGKRRPIGVASLEDKIVQGALREVLQAMYEQDFLSCSYGFRPQRSAHDALRAVDRMAYREGIEWILEADISAFFDSLDRSKLKEMLQRRVVDGSLMRLIGKCLHVGVLDGAEFTRPDEGTVQGSIISPLLGNVYLHYVLDEWFEREIRAQLLGHARLIRYCDDFVMGFTCKEDAERVLGLLTERMAEYGLTLHPEKTRLMPFGRPQNGQKNGKGPATFEFLGFRIFWRRNRKGSWMVGMKTRKARMRRALSALSDFCRSHRHKPLKQQHAALSSRLRGHFNYFGVNGNLKSLARLLVRAERIWLKTLRRRSQRARLTWKRFRDYLKAFPLPQPSVRVQLWEGSP
jgi:RNA-directed DNA polymerase